MVTIIVCALAKTGSTIKIAWPCAAYGPPSLMLAGISLVIACTIGLVVDLPTSVRAARSARDAYIGLALTLLVGVPLVEIVGLLFGVIGSSGSTLLEQLLVGGHLWQLVASACFIVSEFLANLSDLYSAAVSLQTAYNAVSFSQSVLITGCLGTLVTCLGVAENMANLLELMGICMISMGIAIIGAYVSGPGTSIRTVSWLAWAVGIIGGICSYWGIGGYTGSPLIDASLCAATVMVGYQGIKLLYTYVQNMKGLQ